MNKMNIPTKNNEKLKTVVERINKHSRFNTILEACNVMAVQRLKMSDHGKMHSTIVANLGLKILRNLVESGITTSCVSDYGLKKEDAEVIVVLGALMHDLGNSVHRDVHDQVGVVLASQLLEDVLEGVYGEREKQIIICEVMHAMIAHESDMNVFTIEAGVVRLADALDMEAGRARIPFKLGKSDIHSVSAMAIEDVKILPSKEKPVAIEITMSNSAGIFQVDYLLKKKLTGSKLEKYVSVVANVKEGGEKKILKRYEIQIQ